MTEIVRIDISKELLQTLVDSDVIKTSDFNVVKVEVPNFPYAEYPEWKEQQIKSANEYRLLKELEYKIRNRK